MAFDERVWAAALVTLLNNHFTAPVFLFEQEYSERRHYPALFVRTPLDEFYEGTGRFTRTFDVLFVTVRGRGTDSGSKSFEAYEEVSTFFAHLFEGSRQPTDSWIAGSPVFAVSRAEEELTADESNLYAQVFTLRQELSF